MPKKPTAKKPSPLALVWRSLTALLTRQQDTASFQAARLSAIEDRLAALDGGADADAARRDAVAKVNAGRLAEGAGPLAFRIDGDGPDAKIEWVDSRAKYPS